jgi:heme A synthase
MLKKTVSGNSIFTGGFIKKTASGNGDFHWPLALAALKSASENASRTATIEAVCTSDTHSKKVSLNVGSALSFYKKFLYFF